MMPKELSLKYSNGLELLVVLRKGYTYKGICAAKEKPSIRTFSINPDGLQEIRVKHNHRNTIFVILHSQRGRNIVLQRLKGIYKLPKSKILAYEKY